MACLLDILTSMASPALREMLLGSFAWPCGQIPDSGVLGMMQYLVVVTDGHSLVCD